MVTGMIEIAGILVIVMLQVIRKIKNENRIRRIRINN